MAFTLPPLNLSASSAASLGPQTSSNPFNGGTVNFGGSGMGASGGFNVGGLVSQYWPILAVAGAIWYIKRRKRA